MRTKTLLLTAALAAVGATTSMAQVYSVNAVGYINVQIPSGFSMIANQLNASPDNTVQTVFGTPPNGVVLYMFDNATSTYDIVTYVAFLQSWDKPNSVVAPGTGIFILNQGAPYTMTFVGEVPTGTRSTPIPTGFNLVGSQIPQQGPLETVLGYVPSPAPNSDVVYRFQNSTSTYTIDTHVGFLGLWDAAGGLPQDVNGEPTPKVGEGFFLLRGGPATTWTRNFTVN